VVGTTSVSTITAASIARHWGVSKPYLSKLVKAGLDVSKFGSFEDADIWRAQNCPATPARQAGSKLKHQEVAREPVSTIVDKQESGVSTSVDNARRKPATQDSTHADPELTPDDHGSVHLARARVAAESAYALLQDALASREAAQISLSIRNHTMSVDAYVGLRGQIVKLMQKEGQLCYTEEAKSALAAILKVYDVQLSRLPAKIPASDAVREAVTKEIASLRAMMTKGPDQLAKDLQPEEEQK